MPAFSDHKIVMKLMNLGNNTDLYIHSLHIKTHSWVLRVDSSSYKIILYLINFLIKVIEMVLMFFWLKSETGLLLDHFCD